MRRLFIALLLGLGLTTPASADKAVFTYYGARGDAGAQDECAKPNAVFVGVVGRRGAWVDQISVVCGMLSPEGWVSGQASLASRGGNGGGEAPSALCNPDELVTGITPYRTKGSQIAAVSITCMNFRNNRTHTIGFGASSYYNAGPSMKCASGSVGIGMTIRYGKHVNGLGLVCNDSRTVTTTPPAPVVTPPVTPPPAETFVTVIADVRLYKNPGGANVDDTGVDLLKGTANVKLLAQQPPWYNVSWPGHTGWVYSKKGDYESLKLP
jgi:hypothetical protein